MLFRSKDKDLEAAKKVSRWISFIPLSFIAYLISFVVTKGVLIYLANFFAVSDVNDGLTGLIFGRITVPILYSAVAGFIYIATGFAIAPSKSVLVKIFLISLMVAVLIYGLVATIKVKDKRIVLSTFETIGEMLGMILAFGISKSEGGSFN